jgi:peroxiredoxin
MFIRHSRTRTLNASGLLIHSKESVLQIRYHTTTVELEDIPLDIGYASEKVDLKNSSNTLFSIGGQNGATQLLISIPFIDENLLSTLKEFTTLLSINALDGISKSLIVATDRYPLPHLEEWTVGFDYDQAFGDYYGVRLSGGELNGELTKALFILSKDGAVFYHEILSDLSTSFDLDKALVKIAAANNCYTGKGCH